jgi:hypothetical protein
MLALSLSFMELARQPLTTGLLRLDGDPESFLLVRTDRIIEEAAKSTLYVAFSFFHLPTSGIVGIYVSCKPLRDKTRMGFLEQFYGLDGELLRGFIDNAVRGEALHVVYAGGGGMRTTIAETAEEIIGPKCDYDIDIPYEADCRVALEREWTAVLAHHRSIRKPDFRAAGQRIYQLMPEDFHPILPSGNAAVSKQSSANTSAVTLENSMEKLVQASPDGDPLENLVSMLNQLSSRMQDAFEAHMKRARSNVTAASASAILDNISAAFGRSGGIAGTIIGNVLQGVDQDVATIVFYDDLKLRFGITIFKSFNRPLHTYFAKYGSYMEWLGNNIIHADLVEKARQKNVPIFAHLIFVIDNNNQVFAHLCVVPNGRGNNSALTLLPADLLTEQERNRLTQ